MILLHTGERSQTGGYCQQGKLYKCLHYNMFYTIFQIERRHTKSWCNRVKLICLGPSRQPEVVLLESADVRMPHQV